MPILKMTVTVPHQAKTPLDSGWPGSAKPGRPHAVDMTMELIPDDVDHIAVTVGSEHLRLKLSDLQCAMDMLRRAGLPARGGGA